MLVLIPMNSDNINEATITSVDEAQIWAQLRIEEGILVEVLHNTKFDGFENWSEVVVINSDSENIMDFISMSMLIVVAHTQKHIEEIVEAYLFRELHDLAY